MSDRPTAETDSAWQELCCSNLSWYHIAENIKAHSQEKERERDESRELHKKSLREREAAEQESDATLERAHKAERERDEAREALMKIEDRCVDCEDACDDLQKIRDIAVKALEGPK